MKPVGLMEIRQALQDERFRGLFPEIAHEIDKMLRQPHCGSCSVPLAREILNKWPDRVEKFFPGRKVIRPEDEVKALSENYWTVINCHVNELEERLRKLPTGRKQIAITRSGDQVTCVVNDLAIVW